MKEISYLILLFHLISVQSLQISSSSRTSTRLPLPGILQNLNAIVTHIQNPALYSAEWANQLELDEPTLLPFAKYNVKEGELISLFPIESISSQSKEDISASASASTDGTGTRTRMTKRVTLWEKERYPYPHLRSDEEDSSLYIHSRMERSDSPGWYGNLVPSCNSDKEGNCVFIPLPGVAPLCGMVATRAISKGEAILQHDCKRTDESSNRNLATRVAKMYANEIGELMTYLQMVYQQLPPNSQSLLQGQGNDSNPTFHSIQASYPNLQKIHTNPDIYVIPDFLTQDECDRLILKSRQKMQPCLVKNAETGAVEPDPSRTSINANIPRREVPSITQKILNLTQSCEEQLETLQVLNYQQGQQFYPHTDGFDGPTSACGFLDSGRIATVFCYLNDVQEGGRTMFTKLGLEGLEIKPERGLAVIHYPMSLELVEDERTEHQGGVAVDEKWILTTWVWKHLNGDYRYDDETLPGLSGDVI